MDAKKKVVILGGGNGASISIQALKPYLAHYSLSAVIAMSDSGRSSGKFRKEFGILPPADILRAILAMSEYEYELLKHIFYDVRAQDNPKLEGLAVGHLFFALTNHYSGNIFDPITLLSRAVKAQGTVIPVTLTLSDLSVELSNGKTIVGEGAIDRPDWNRSITIERAWLEHDPPAYEHAVRAIEEAEILIIGPGSLYTSIVATLLPKGIKEAIGRSQAQLVFVSGNTIESDGETGPTSTSELVGVLHSYLPREVDVVISNTVELNEKQKEFYREKKWERLNVDNENIPVPVISQSIERMHGSIDPLKLGVVLHNFVLNNT